MMCGGELHFGGKKHGRSLGLGGIESIRGWTIIRI